MFNEGGFVMNFPAMAKSTFDRLKENKEFIFITDLIISELKSIKNAVLRAKFVHKRVDDYTTDIFAHPIVKELKGCKKGCSGCCHTEVSVTEDESELLAYRVRTDTKIDYFRLHLQKQAIRDGKDFLTIPYEMRACVFLNEEGLCRVYNDRPSVCRTNAVLGTSEQCSTVGGAMLPQRLIKTEVADMAIMGSFLASRKNGSLSNMLWDKLNEPKPIAIKANMHPVIDYKAIKDHEP